MLQQHTTKMELINNGVCVFLLLLALFTSANATCAPRNFSISMPPVGSQIPPQQAPSPESPEQASPAPEAPEQSLTPEAPEQSPTSEAPEQAPVPESPKSTPTTADVNEVSGLLDRSDLNLNKLHTELESSAGSNEKVELVEICDVTSNPQLCKNSISTHTAGSTMDPSTALKTEIEQSMKEVEKAIATLNALIQDSAASHAEVECYDTCLENFEMAIDDLKSGLEAIDVKDTGKMESVLTAVMTDLTTCDDTFIEMGVDSPLDNLSTKMGKFASNCLAISKLLL